MSEGKVRMRKYTVFDKATGEDTKPVADTVKPDPTEETICLLDCSVRGGSSGKKTRIAGNLRFAEGVG